MEILKPKEIETILRMIFSVIFTFSLFLDRKISFNGFCLKIF